MKKAGCWNNKFLNWQSLEFLICPFNVDLLREVELKEDRDGRLYLGCHSIGELTHGGEKNSAN